MAKATVTTKAKHTPSENISTIATEKKHSKYYEYLINAWIFLPVIAYFKVVNEYALNLPILDDYNAVLKFLNDFKVASFGDKLGLLFLQHNEHRILSSRLIFVLYNAIAGNINFINLIYIANLQLVIIFGICIHFIKKAIPKYWNITSLMVGFCLFDLSNYDNADFAMCGMVNYGVIMLFLLSLLFYSLDNRKYIVWAIVCQALCIYSSGNGIIAAFALVLYTFFTRDRLKIIYCTAAFLIFAPLYYYHYIPAADQSTYSHDVNKMVPFFFHLVGGHFGYENGIVAGVALLVVFAVVFPINKLKIKENALPFLCIIAFILASDAAMAVFRSNVKMLDSYSSRYLINPNLLAALAFVLVMFRMKTTKYLWPATIVMSALYLYMYSLNYTYGEAGFARYQYRARNIEYYYGEGREIEAKQITDKSCSLGIYCIQDERGL